MSDSYLPAILASLETRDERLNTPNHYFKAFQQALTTRTKVNVPHPTTSELSEQTHTNDPQTHQQPAENNQLQNQVSDLQLQLSNSQEQLRNIREEQYLKTRSVQELYDEIIALNMQLNLSEAKRKSLQDQLGL